MQAQLVERGHRSTGVADLLLAAVAEIRGLTLLHDDADFDVIASGTGQDMGGAAGHDPVTMR